MIPSSPRRTLLFLLLSSLAYFAPDLLVPAEWARSHEYAILSNLYQGALVIGGFYWGSAICRKLIVHAVEPGYLMTAAQRVRAGLIGNGLNVPPVVLFAHALPFVLTIGLLPKGCVVFFSTGLADRLDSAGLKFVLARAAVHATLPHRLGAILPLLAFTMLLPDYPKSGGAWFIAGGFLAVWLALHWALELAVDRRAAKMMGSGAAAALQAVLAVTSPHPSWLTIQPPLLWRLRAVQQRAD